LDAYEKGWEQIKNGIKSHTLHCIHYDIVF
jgi:hypothetical protein